MAFSASRGNVSITAHTASEAPVPMSGASPAMVTEAVPSRNRQPGSDAESSLSPKSANANPMGIVTTVRAVPK